MYRVRRVRIQCRFVPEFHDAAVGESLRPRRNVSAVAGLEQPWNLSLQRSNLSRRPVFHFRRDARMPLKQKRVNVHIPPRSPSGNLPTNRPEYRTEAATEAVTGYLFFDRVSICCFAHMSSGWSSNTLR